MGLIKTSLIAVLFAILLNNLPGWIMQDKEPLPRKGSVDPKWRRVQDKFNELLDSKLKKGGAIAVYYKNKLVVDLYGGYANAEARVPFDEKTLTQIFSTTKGVTAMLIAMLVDRGLLEYDKPVADYWPEFAQNGKGKITVEQLMSHQAGLVAIDEPFSVYDDLDVVGNILAKQPPNWKPGATHGYHALTFGLYAEQLLRRVDPMGRDLSQFFREEIAQPFGLDFYIGLPLEENYRCAHMYDARMLPDLLLMPHRWNMYYNVFFGGGKSLTSRSFMNPKETMKPGVMNQPRFRNTTNPSIMGFTTAASLAGFYNMLLNGAKGKPPLLSQEAIAKVSEPLAVGLDECLFFNITYGRGTALHETPLGGYMFGTPGAGGQMGYADAKHYLAWGYITNYHFLQMPPEHPTYDPLQKAIYDTVRELES